MENAFKNWIITLLIAGTVSAVLTIFSEGGKNHKTVEKCAGIVLSLLIIAPLPVLFGKAKNIGDRFNYDYDKDRNYLDGAENYVIGLITEKIEYNLKNSGFENATVSIDGSYKDAELNIEYVIVNLNTAVIDGENEHIHNREKAIKAVTEAIKIEKNRIIVYE